MRKETKAIAMAFINGKPARKARTSTDGHTIYLHGNRIAWRTADGSIYATLAGWNSVTTRERLNGLCELIGLGRPFHCKRFEPFFNGEEIDTTQNILIRSAHLV